MSRKAIVDTAVELVSSGQHGFTCNALRQACDEQGWNRYLTLAAWQDFAGPALPEWWGRAGELQARAIAERWKQERIELLQRFKETLP